MSATPRDTASRLGRRLACHQALHDPQLSPGNGSGWLKPLQAWQAARLERSFSGFLQDPARRPAARFFLTDVYGDHDFARWAAQRNQPLAFAPRLAAAMNDAHGFHVGSLHINEGALIVQGLGGIQHPLQPVPGVFGSSRLRPADGWQRTGGERQDRAIQEPALHAEA